MSGYNFGWGYFPHPLGHNPGSSYSYDPFNLNNPRENHQRNSHHTGYQGQDSHNQQPLKSIEPKAEQPCYYEVLQVCKTADSQEIKKAYKKQSLIWHPDKNAQNNLEAEEKFKLISEAYQVLSDDNKRREYDSRGLIPSQMTDSYSNRQEFYNSFQSGVFTSPFELFNQMFGEFAFNQSSLIDSPFQPRDAFFNDASYMGPFGASHLSPFGMLGCPGNGFMNPYPHAPNFSHFGGGSSNSSFSYSSTSSSTSISGGHHVKKTSSVVNGRSTTVIETTDSQGNVKREVLYS